ncbi:MAG: ABC transporter permease [Acidimicrobiales bacterium]
MSQPSSPTPQLLGATDDGEAEAAIAPAVALDSEVGGRKKGWGLGAWLAAGWLILIVGSAILAPILPLNDPTAEVAQKRLAPFQPGGPLLGADANGRDLLSRTIYGARTSLVIAVCAIGLGLLIGGLLGLLAGYFRNWLGNSLVSLFDILLAIPQLVLALSLVSVLKGNPADTESFRLPVTLTLIIALGIVSIPLLARITRASTLSWSQREFVTAARAQGATHSRILFREVLPNVLPAMVSIALLGMAIAIVAEGGLAILGASVEPPTATWGTMIATGKTDLEEAPFIVWIPVAAIFLTATSLNYLGDVIRDRFDVRESAL